MIQISRSSWRALVAAIAIAGVAVAGCAVLVYMLNDAVKGNQVYAAENRDLIKQQKEQAQAQALQVEVERQKLLALQLYVQGLQGQVRGLGATPLQVPQAVQKILVPGPSRSSSPSATATPRPRATPSPPSRPTTPPPRSPSPAPSPTSTCVVKLGNVCVPRIGP